ncbi:putative ATP-dependent DNA helicase Q1 [Saccostrea echinata]|uniref:putative ATP-dependent DNA helicase Q1 n=1 Tax=Saccostrea echinata TaxID=191078 RepID=UPI002A80D1BB|nr:putative ATP-dependent DNA helicase Q1 [Saccostrea echinata]
MYHSETPLEKKEIILKAIQNPDSDLRLVIATSSLGMGVDCAKFYNVILYGPPKTVVELIQEIGRVGRDGQTSTALLLYNSFNLCKVESDVKNIIKSDKCRRFALLQPFLNQQELHDLGKNTGSSLCCDICAKVNPDQSSLSNIEKLLTINFNDDENVNLASDSSDDTVSYIMLKMNFLTILFRNYTE